MVFPAVARSGEENGGSVRTGEPTPVYAVLRSPLGGAAVLQFLHLLQTWHHPRAAPIGSGSVVLRAGNVLADVVAGGIGAVAMGVGIPVVTGLLRSLAPCEVAAVVLGLLRAHVATGPLRAARQAEVNQMRMMRVGAGGVGLLCTATTAQGKAQAGDSTGLGGALPDRHPAEPGVECQLPPRFTRYSRRGPDESLLGLVDSEVGIIAAAEPVLAPLPHVAAHVVQPQLVRSFGGNRMGGGAAVVPIPRHIINVVAAGVLVALAAVAAAGGILPLGLGGQTEVLPCHLVQLADERLAVVPAHILHRALQVAGEMAGVAAHHGLPQLLGDLGLPDAVARQRHLVGRFLIVEGIAALLGGGAHGERATLARPPS